MISSMALVLLKTGITHPGDVGAPDDLTAPTINQDQMATAQKLLLFWRKPAVSRSMAETQLIADVQRKCWWDGVEVDVPASSTSKETMKVKVWARRVWTLELSLVSDVR